MNDEIVEDIRARLNRLPVLIGEGVTVPALPSPDTVPAGTVIYLGAMGLTNSVGTLQWMIAP